jgi:hypothetical protein
MKISFVEIKSINSKFNILEYGLLVGLAGGLLVAYYTSSSFSSYSYLIVGDVLGVICLLLTVVGLVRVGYNVYYKVTEKKLEKMVS